MEAFNLSDEDQGFILEGLALLAEVKATAFRGMQTEAPQLCTGPRAFTDRDFGIPQIAALAERIGGAG